MPDREYDWYKKVEPTSPLMQGDLVLDCPILIPPNTFKYEEGTTLQIQAETVEYDVVIMTQSCDLQNNKIELVQICQYYSLEELAETNSYFGGAIGKESLRKGYSHKFHLMVAPPKDNERERYIVVDFRNVYGIGYKLLKKIAEEQGKRYQLQPPYREHLSQAFARYFMRVGLPLDIPPFG